MAVKENRTKILLLSGGIMAFLLIAVVIFLVSGYGKKTSYEYYLDLGERYLSEMKYEESVVAYSKAIELNPDCLDAFVGRGDAYFALNELEKAEDDYWEAESLHETGEFPDIYLRLAKVYMAGGNWYEAFGVLEEGLFIIEDMADRTPEYDEMEEEKNSTSEYEEDGKKDQVKEKELKPFIKKRLRYLFSIPHIWFILDTDGLHEKFIIKPGDGKGADMPTNLIDFSGECLIRGFEDAIWQTENGYIKIYYEDKEGKETNSYQAYFYGEHHSYQDTIDEGIRIYIQFYDKDGTLLEEREVSPDTKQYEIKNLYPSIDQTQENALICEEDEAGTHVRDNSGEELAYFENSSERICSVGTRGGLLYVNVIPLDEKGKEGYSKAYTSFYMYE